MLGISTSLSRIVKQPRTYVKDGLKLYMPYRGSSIKGTQFVGEGSTSFDGNNDEVTLASTVNIGTVHTLSAWMKIPDPTIMTNNIAIGSQVSGVYLINLYAPSNTVNSIYYGNGSHAVTVPYADDQAWHMITVVRDGTSVKFYVDAVQEGATQTLSGNVDASYNRLGRGSGAQYLTGSMKNVAIWNRALTATEVQNLMYKTYPQVSGRLASGLISWWTLGKGHTALGGIVGGVTAIDETGNNHAVGGVSGATYNNVLYGGYTPVIPRGIDNASTVQADAIGSGSAFFDEDNADYISMGDVAELTPPHATGFSVSCWIKFVSLNGDTCIISKHLNYGDPDDAGEYYIINDDGICEFVIVDDSASASIGTYTGTVFVVGNWYHLACTYDGGIASSGCLVYIDGILQAHNANATGSGFHTSSPENTEHHFRIGTFADSGEPHDGNICQVGFWDAVLTQAQIQSIMEKTYEEFDATEKADLISYWPLDTSSNLAAGSDNVKDSHGSNHGTLG